MVTGVGGIYGERQDESLGELAVDSPAEEAKVEVDRPLLCARLNSPVTHIWVVYLGLAALRVACAPTWATRRGLQFGILGGLDFLCPASSLCLELLDRVVVYSKDVPAIYFTATALRFAGDAVAGSSVYSQQHTALRCQPC